MREPSPKPLRALRDLEESLRWLVCPVCRAPLAADGDAIRCQGCHRRYPVIDGIPVLLADRSTLSE
ncbi:MAG: Trm112 family protein [Acidobacteriota bacterium]|nr:Trm112 family protein [Acidobacteriota bacterium]